METIEIKVGKETAKKWMDADSRIKSELGKSFSQQIDSITRNRAEANFDQLLKDIRREAQENGLTPEILQEILNEA